MNELVVSHQLSVVGCQSPDYSEENLETEDRKLKTGDWRLKTKNFKRG